MGKSHFNERSWTNQRGMAAPNSTILPSLLGEIVIKPWCITVIDKKDGVPPPIMLTGRCSDVSWAYKSMAASPFHNTRRHQFVPRRVTMMDIVDRRILRVATHLKRQGALSGYRDISAPNTITGPNSRPP